MRIPALSEEPWNQRAAIIPLTQRESLLAWLEESGRLTARSAQDFDYRPEEAPELAELMLSDDQEFDIDGEEFGDDIGLDEDA